MKNLFLFSVILALILFIDYLLLAVAGCIANACGAGQSFFCGPFCYMGIALLGLSLLVPAGIWAYRHRTSGVN